MDKRAVVQAALYLVSLEKLYMFLWRKKPPACRRKNFLHSAGGVLRARGHRRTGEDSALQSAPGRQFQCFRAFRKVNGVTAGESVRLRLVTDREIVYAEHT